MRFDFEHIAGWINDGARVLDLGCEEGDMLAYLQDKRGVQGIGVDIDNDYLASCLARGVQAIHATSAKIYLYSLITPLILSFCHKPCKVSAGHRKNY